MAADAGKALAWIAAAGTAAGIAYTAIAISRVRAFRNAAARAAGAGSTPITILKPLHGEEPQLFENLCSFCEQDYPAYQVIFGAADPADPALNVARAVAERFPDREIGIVAGGNAQPAANPKIGNVLGMIDRARHPIVAIADSDIRVGPAYLRTLAACFDDPRTGAATCIYGGVPAGPSASRLGAMHVNDQFAPSVMVANALEPLTYCFGATMAVRRDVLERIGGLRALGDHLADDYLLGKLVADAGLRVALAPYAAQTIVSDRTLRELWNHERRWSRAVLGRRPAGYVGSIVTYVLPFALAYAALARTPSSLRLLAVASVLRVWLHFEGRAAFAPHTAPTPWLIPLRDFFGVTVWLGAFFGKRVQWRNDDYRLDAGGRMAAGTKEM